jgi:hypothetical protein
VDQGQDREPRQTHAIPVNRELCYRSGKEKGIEAREEWAIVSEEIEKNAFIRLFYVRLKL